MMNMENANKFPRNCLNKLQAVYPMLKKAEKRAADKLLDDPKGITNQTIVEASVSTGCSETTWIRLSKRLGYKGFLGLKAELSEHLKSNGDRSSENVTEIYGDINKQSTYMEIAQRVFESSINALTDTFQLIDDKGYKRAVDALLKAPRIVLCGVGDAYAVVRSTYQKFFRAGLDVYESSDQDLQLVAISKLKPNDIVIAISYSGRTRNILELVKYAREKGATVLSITNFPTSPLTKNSDIVLLTAAFKQQVSGEIASKRITQLCIIESLYVNLLLKSSQDLDSHIRDSNSAVDINKF